MVNPLALFMCVCVFLHFSSNKYIPCISCVVVLGSCAVCQLSEFIPCSFIRDKCACTCVFLFLFIVIASCLCLAYTFLFCVCVCFFFCLICPVVFATIQQHPIFFLFLFLAFCDRGRALIPLFLFCLFNNTTVVIILVLFFFVCVSLFFILPIFCCCSFSLLPQPLLLNYTQTSALLLLLSFILICSFYFCCFFFFFALTSADLRLLLLCKRRNPFDFLFFLGSFSNFFRLFFSLSVLCLSVEAHVGRETSVL